ncbi:MAG: PAS domain S-box protein [Anaerolineae bacterium]
MQQRSGEIVACNPAAERILGLTQDQMMGRTSVDPRWQAIHEDGTSFPGESHPAIRTLQTGQPQRNVTMGVHKPDGNLTWILINSEPLFQPGASEPYAVVATFSDITQQRQAEDLLRQSEQKFRQVVEQSMMRLCWPMKPDD